MKGILFSLSLLGLLMLSACGPKEPEFDASGSFEVDETIVSSEVTGQLLQFSVHEGDSLSKGQVVGRVDSTGLSLQKQQVEATIQSLQEKTMSVAPQVAMLEDQVQAQQAQLDHMIYERDRVARLLKDNAATQKQLDDMNSQIDVMRKQIDATKEQIAVQRTTVGTQNRSVMSQKAPLEKQADQLQVMLSKSNIINPINGVVLEKYAQQGELVAPGKPLYKIADLSWLNLRAYVTQDQLSKVRLGQEVKVLVDNGAKDYRTYTGKVIWVSGEAEFTPKSIQTKEERTNLVYATKIRVKNDGYLKVGMYGEVQLQNTK
jgi:HlyD family secretion protein